MKRKYSISKAITDEQAAEALAEVQARTGCDGAEYSDDRKYIIVSAEDDKITHVMNRAVNIFARVCDEASLSFVGFVYDEK